MAIFQDGQNLWMYKGDTGNIIFSGLPTDKAYSVYMSIYDESGEKILKEIEATNFSLGVATFVINEAISDTLKVGEFTYALKICAGGSEDTVIPETKLVNGVYEAQPAPVFEVKYKRVEGD